MVSWEPYLLRSDVPPEGRPLIYKPGKEKDGPTFWKFADRAQKLGIDMTGEVDLVPNTLLSHVLLEWAHKQQQENQHYLKGLIFEAYYSKNIFLNVENLAMLAGQAGYDAAAAHEYLLSRKGEGEVKRRSDEAKSAINGIPFFVINDKPAFSGAQDPAYFEQVLRSSAR
jgi:predicted DsbA family dithiol-disulfide isomerase